MADLIKNPEEWFIEAVKKKMEGSLSVADEKNLFNSCREKNFVITDEMADLMLKNNFLTPVLWFNESWIPKRKHIDWALSKNTQQKEFLWSCKKWVPTEEDVAIGLSDDNNQILKIVISRSDIRLTQVQVDNILDNGAYAVKVALWKNHDISFSASEHQVEQCLRERYLIGVVLESPNFNPSGAQIEKGLSGGYPELGEDCLSSWEVYRAKFEANLLKDRVNIKEEFFTPKAL